ncbi:uncharacterized protein LOC129596738 isoform X2 [Paramacrobiotus metropolitanus]|uniref:uncharacterized protein LOC129596738 isoform X2 n=1 Tax=Paramacrobiotus metropolitanus TaxID=2943436 RepID=UPI0024458260|nr:uncharacterized protein LOC129596738 isoform X2 [Paramacrobiotus metropolitanus]
MASQGPSPHSPKARFNRWINKPWKSLSLLPRQRSKETLRADISATALGTIADDSNCRQILGRNLQPAVYEFATGQFSLGFICDVDWPRRRVFVDFACHNRPPQWLPAGSVRWHKPVITCEILPGEPVVVALRPSSDQPYVFQPAQIIFPAARDNNGNFGPICVETTCPDSVYPIRKFVHAVQVRVVADYPEQCHESDEPLSVVEYCRLLQKQTAPLEWCPDAANIDLRYLLRAYNEISWIKVVRIWLDTKGIHCVYTTSKPGFFDEPPLEYLVLRSKWLHAVQLGSLLDSNNTGANRDRSVSLGMLPFDLHKLTLLEILDIHSIVSAQKVCKAWYDILTGRRDNQHVAVDLTNPLPDDPFNQERKYSRFHLLNVLDKVVTKATVSLTLMNGSLTPELDIYLCQFLSIKVPRLARIFLKNIRCFGAVTQNNEKQRVEWTTLSYLMQACQVMHLRNVTIPKIFAPIAGLWCAPAGFREDVGVVVKKATLHCTQRETDRLGRFLQVLNTGCPELSTREITDINEACHKIIIHPEHPLHSRLLLMLTLLNEPVTGKLRPPLCRLAAHAFRYSYLVATSSICKTDR